MALSIEASLTVFEHPLKSKIQESRMQLWKLRRALGGSPSEAGLSRMLSGIDPMPKGIETKIKAILDEINKPMTASK